LLEHIPPTGRIYISAEFRWKHFSGIIHYSDHGTVDIEIDKVGFLGAIQVGEANFRPTVHTPGVGFQLGNFKFTFHGKISWIYDGLIDIFHPLILHEINARVPDAINKAINVQAEEALAKLQIRVPWKGSIMDFSLLAPPTFVSPAYFLFEVLGEFQDRANPTPCPYTPAPLPPTQNNNMLQVYIDDFVPNCALNAFYQEGIFKIIVTSADAPAKYQRFFNTSQYWLILHPLYAKYPNMAMQFVISAAQVPSVTFNTNISSLVIVDISVVVLAPGKPQEAFILSATLNASLFLGFKPKTNTIYGSIQNLGCKIALVSSAIGPLDIIPLIDVLLEPVCHDLPVLVNQFLVLGYPIPSFFGFSLVNPIITIGKGYLGLSSSVQYG